MGVAWPARLRRSPRGRRVLTRWLVSSWRLATLVGRGVTTAEAAREARFDALFQRCEREIYAYLYRVTGDRQTASDLTQETFLRAWQHFDKVERYAGPEGWLFRVATNLALNVRRHRAIVGAHVPLSEEHEAEFGDPAGSIEERDAVHATLLSLPSHMRAALVLREVHGLPFEEVARVLGVTHAAAKMTLSRARERFRQAYLDPSSPNRPRREEERR